MAITSIFKRGVVFLALTVALPVAALAMIDPAEIADGGPARPVSAISTGAAPAIHMVRDADGCRADEAASARALTAAPERAQHSVAAFACGRWTGGAPAAMGGTIEASQ